MSIGVLSEYIPPSWFHPKGIFKVVSRLWDRLPDIEGSLFLTFTLDPSKFDGPADGFQVARKRIRKLFYKLRKGIVWKGKEYKIDCPYAVKVEFHRNGWPHFHMIFLTKRFLPADLVTHLWGFGRTDVKRIKTSEFNYLLKYVTKGPTLPDWVLEMPRLRIFQSSRGFLKPLPKKQAPEENEKREPKKRRTASNIKERIYNWSLKGKLTSEDGTKVRTIDFLIPMKAILMQLVVDLARAGRYLGNNKVIINSKKELYEWQQKALSMVRSQEYLWPDGLCPPLLNSVFGKTEAANTYELKRKSPQCCGW